MAWKGCKPVSAKLKRIYRSASEKEALLALDDFAARWDDKYPQIVKIWRSNRDNLNTLFRYPDDIRKGIYTTNTIESLNSVIHKLIKKRKIFPMDTSAKKVIHLAIREASQKWIMPIQKLESGTESFYDRI